MTRHDDDPIVRALLGAAAGVVGTIAIQSLLKAGGKYAPSTVPPMRQEPGHFMVRQVERLLPTSALVRIPDKAEDLAGKAMGFGYGMLFGALYGLLRPRASSILAEGTVLGLISWAAGFLGWLPATGLMPPVWKHKPAQAIAPPIEHAVYGVATVAAFEQLAEHV